MLIKIFKFNCTDYYRSKYLNNCDLLNKFMFKSTKLFPCVNKITFNFPLKNLLLFSVASTKSKDIKSILFFVLFFCKKVCLHVSKKKLIQKMSLHTMFVPLSFLFAFLDCFNSLLRQVNVRDSFIQVNFTVLKKSKI